MGKETGGKGPRPYVTARELSKLLGVHRRTIYTWITKRKLPQPTIVSGPIRPNSLRGWSRLELKKLVAMGRRLMEGWGEVKARESSPDSAPSPSSKQPSSEPFTRREILEAFASWLDGNAEMDLDSLLDRARMYRDRVAELRKELESLMKGE